ncbi:MAG: hypothetical protein AB1705_11695 [Verrucomicrobiota bacterium]
MTNDEGQMTKEAQKNRAASKPPVVDWARFVRKRRAWMKKNYKGPALSGEALREFDQLLSNDGRIWRTNDS